MNIVEHLENEIDESGIELIQNYTFKSLNIKGLYCDGTIALNKNIKTMSEKACILAEELGHHHTSNGNIVDQTKVENRKQERIARIWAYDKLIDLFRIAHAFEAGCTSRYEIAEYLGVTEEFLQDALDCYQQKYGVCRQIENYIIYFEPNLGVLRLNKNWGGYE